MTTCRVPRGKLVDCAVGLERFELPDSVENADERTMALKLTRCEQFVRTLRGEKPGLGAMLFEQLTGAGPYFAFADHVVRR